MSHNTVVAMSGVLERCGQRFQEDVVFHRLPVTVLAMFGVKLVPTIATTGTSPLLGHVRDRADMGTGRRPDKGPTSRRCQLPALRESGQHEHLVDNPIATL